VDGAILWSETVATETGCAWTDERVALLVSRSPAMVHVFDRSTGYDVMIPFERWAAVPDLTRVEGICPQAAEALLDAHRHALRLFPDPRVLQARVDWKPRDERRRKASAARKSLPPSTKAAQNWIPVPPAPERERPCPRCQKPATRMQDPETGEPVYACAGCGISFEVSGS
jgi:hypothetical protein